MSEPQENHLLGDSYTKKAENCLKKLKNQINMEIISTLIDKRHLDLSKEVGYNIEKVSVFLCEHCGVILSTKQSLKHDMVIIHSEIVTTYQCNKYPTTCNR